MLRRRRVLSIALLLVLLGAGGGYRLAHGEGPSPVLATVTVGTMPGMVAVDAATNRAFVTDSADHTVSVLDAATGRVLRTTRLGDEPDVVAADETTGRIFVLTDPNNTVAMLDATDGALLRTVAVTTEDLAVDGRTGRVVVSGEPPVSSDPGVVTEVDGRSGAVLHRAIVGGTAAWGVAVDDRAGLAYVTDASDDSLVLVDEADGRVVRSVPVGIGPAAVAVDAATGRAFVTDNGDGTVTMVEARSGAVLRVIKVGPYPARVAVDERAGHVFIVHGRGGDRQNFPFAPDDAGGVTMLDERSGAVLRALPVGGYPLDDVGYVGAMNLAVDRRRGRVFVINLTPGAALGSGVDGSVSVLDAVSGRVLRTIEVGRHPISLAVDEATARLFVVNTNSGCVPTDHFGWIPSSIRHWLPLISQPPTATCNMPGTVSVIDTSRL